MDAIGEIVEAKAGLCRIRGRMWPKWRGNSFLVPESGIIAFAQFL
jgi:hypothetical protein